MGERLVNLEAFWWDDDLIHLGEFRWNKGPVGANTGVWFPAHDKLEVSAHAQAESSPNCHRCRTWAQEQIDALQELLR